MPRATSRRVADEGFRPQLDRTRRDLGPKRHHASAAFVLAHLERALERRRNRLDVVRIHDQRFGELVRGSGELAQHEHAVAVDARRDVLLGDEIHAVAQRRDEHHVGRAVARGELDLVHRVVHVVNRRALCKVAVRAVDATGHLLDLALELAVRAHVLARRHRDLEQPELSAIVGSPLEQELDGQELAGDPLRVVEPIDAEHELLVAVRGAQPLHVASMTREFGGERLESLGRRCPSGKRGAARCDRPRSTRSTSVSRPSTLSSDAEKWRWSLKV